jgi:hypothetical protein
MRLTPRVAGFGSEYPAGFKLECMAGFVGTRTVVGAVLSGTLEFVPPEPGERTRILGVFDDADRKSPQIGDQSLHLPNIDHVFGLLDDLCLYRDRAHRHWLYGGEQHLHDNRLPRSRTDLGSDRMGNQG